MPFYLATLYNHKIVSVVFSIGFISVYFILFFYSGLVFTAATSFRTSRSLRMLTIVGLIFFLCIFLVTVAAV